MALIQYLKPPTPKPRPSFAAVAEFYDRLQEKRWDEAWDLLTPTMKERAYKNNKDAFIDGYRNTQRIKLLSINFYQEASHVSHDYLAYYQSETNTPVIFGAENIMEWPVRDLPRLVAVTDDLRARLEQNAIDVATLDKMKLSLLFVANRGDVLRWSIRNSQPDANLDGIFSGDRTVARLFGNMITIERVNNRWLIERINVIPSHIE